MISAAPSKVLFLFSGTALARGKKTKSTKRFTRNVNGCDITKGGLPELSVLAQIVSKQLYKQKYKKQMDFFSHFSGIQDEHTGA